MADDPCQVDEPDKAHEFQALVVQAIHAAEAASDSTHRLMRNLMEDEPSEALALGKVWKMQVEAHRTLVSKLQDMGLSLEDPT